MTTKSLSTNQRYNSIFYSNSISEGFSITSRDPKKWGPPYWQTIFSTAAKYPKINPTQQDKERAIHFFSIIGHGLPCSKCRVSYGELMRRFPIEDALQNRKTLLTWVYIIRDQVNRKLICQERNELKKQLSILPDNINEKTVNQLKQKILYTKPSPSLHSVLDKWFFYHEKI